MCVWHISKFHLIVRHNAQPMITTSMTSAKFNLHNESNVSSAASTWSIIRMTSRCDSRKANSYKFPLDTHHISEKFQRVPEERQFASSPADDVMKITPTYLMGASKTNISQEAVHPKFWGRKELPQWEETRACMSSHCNCVGRLCEQCESCPKNSRQKCWMLCTSSGCRRIFIESKMIHLKASDKRRLSVTYTSLAFREDPVMQFVSEREPTNEIQKELFTRALWTQNKYWDVIYLYTFWEASSRLKDKVGWKNIHSFVVFPSLFLFIIWLKPIPVFSTVLCFASFFLSPPFTKYKQKSSAHFILKDSLLWSHKVAWLFRVDFFQNSPAFYVAFLGTLCAIVWVCVFNSFL